MCNTGTVLPLGSHVVSQVFGKLAACLTLMSARFDSGEGQVEDCELVIDEGDIEDDVEGNLGVEIRMAGVVEDDRGAGFGVGFAVQIPSAAPHVAANPQHCLPQHV